MINNLVSLSVQYRVDCDKKNYGLRCGFHDRAFDFIQKNGITFEASYPYTTKYENTSSSFLFLSQKVFVQNCGTKINHAIMVVGYGQTVDVIKYWILRNSWGSMWGEDGYMRMLRGICNQEGLCGITKKT
ncbi:hypothetical protein KSP40_PGU004932 [Platanthera guangdongensis]|uniref:Peptidase C1A papain C-terminal domain-containing protein n=1 Tax=Platanthera guangdongensis TaxID=2320717 RepID=A0ABR2N2S7_9ASPA